MLQISNKSTQATIYFVETHQEKIPDGFDLSKFHFAETETIVLPEEFVYEMNHFNCNTNE